MSFYVDIFGVVNEVLLRQSVVCRCRKTGSPFVALVIAPFLVIECQLAHKADEHSEHLLLEIAVRPGQFLAGFVGGTHPSVHKVGELLGKSLVLFGDCLSWKSLIVHNF